MLKSTSKIDKKSEPKYPSNPDYLLFETSKQKVVRISREDYEVKYNVKWDEGNCWDNAVSESFFHTLKTELVYHLTFKTREEAKKSIFEYIEVFYNRRRVHSSNDYLSPFDYENSRECA